MKKTVTSLLSDSIATAIAVAAEVVTLTTTTATTTAAAMTIAIKSYSYQLLLLIITTAKITAVIMKDTRQLSPVFTPPLHKSLMGLRSVFFVLHPLYKLNHLPIP